MDINNVSFYDNHSDNDYNMEIEDIEPDVSLKRKRTAGVALFYSCTSVRLTQSWLGPSIIAMDTTARHVLERDAVSRRARRLYSCYHMPQLQPTYCTISMQGLLWAGPFLS
jgi:hypothetical protein